jgi:hypothetical protein
VRTGSRQAVRAPRSEAMTPTRTKRSWFHDRMPRPMSPTESQRECPVDVGVIKLLAV